MAVNEGTLRRVVIIGSGFVGMSMAYSLINHRGIDELVLVDMQREKAEGEALDLISCLPYAEGKVHVFAGSYSDCRDANVVLVSAGSHQRPGQTDEEYAERNTRTIKLIGERIKDSGFNGVLVVATNPCDLMTYALWKTTGLPYKQVFGIGTMLDSARLRHQIGEFLELSPESIYAYLLGEYGDNSFVSWTNCYVGCKSLLEIVEERQVPFQYLQSMYEQVRDANYEIVQKKKAAYYGVGMALARLTDAIMNNENIILPLSAYQHLQYGHEGFYISTPAVVNRRGVREVIKLPFTAVDQEKFDRACQHVKYLIETVVDPTLAQ
ncbi:MAG: L-lactate dehydrogenase [Erysipelotrichaceae bacterium]|nr:L-lactate dehydrogenase [Erysipelotrichaceae bacterium]